MPIYNEAQLSSYVDQIFERLRAIENQMAAVSQAAGVPYDRPGAGAPPNRHAGEAESFFVLDGTFKFTVEGETIPLGAGGFLAVPDGAVHVFRNSGEAPGRLLIYNTPGRVHEEFYSLCGQAQPVGATMFPENAPKPDIGAIIETGTRAGIVFVREGAPG